MEIKDIVQVVGGTQFNKAKLSHKNFHEIQTDTRKLEENDIFIALKGPNFDGHEFVKEAIQKKVSLIIIEHDILVDNNTIPIIKVESTLESLFKIAKLYLKTYHPMVIAITGSVGKTTTKEMIASVLSKKYNILKSQGNKNNHIGVPETIFHLQKKHDIIVLELGMNHEHEIEKLSKLVEPTIAVITNIGTAHIGNLGTKENILKAKMEIIEGMKEGLLIVNKEDELLNKIEVNEPIMIDKIGFDNKQFKFINIISDLNGSKFTLQSQNIYYAGKIELLGKALFTNVALAIEVGLLLDIEMKEILEALSEYKPMQQRMNVEQHGNYIILDDCYNASYESLITHLQFLDSLEKPKVLILADILELGKESQNIHQKIGKILQEIYASEIILIGDQMKIAKEECFSAKHFLTNQEAIKYLKEQNFTPNTIFYLKGSRRMKLEEIKKELFF